MCEWGTTTPVVVTTLASLSHTGRNEVGPKPVDSCIAPLVEALNAGGIFTTSSCCGHGRAPGSILLVDGRDLRIHSREDRPDDAAD